MPPAGTGGYVRAWVAGGEPGDPVDVDLGDPVDVPQAASNVAMTTKAHDRRIDVHCVTPDRTVPGRRESAAHPAHQGYGYVLSESM